LLPEPSANTVFLLSPANAGGARADLLTNPHAKFALARELRSASGARLCDVFTFLSSLYFRGKLAYARHFAAPPEGLPGVLLIVPGRGLCTAEQRVTLGELKALAAIDVDAKNEAFAAPLRRDACQLATLLPHAARVVLLGSIATAKYVDPLLDAFAERLLFPREFVGRGDMSRGGLLLRCTREHAELSYAPVLEAARTGPRAKRIALLPLKHE
jgi:hypothetical protein